MDVTILSSVPWCVIGTPNSDVTVPAAAVSLKTAASDFHATLG
jgi:hypothetical protein